MPQAKTSQEVRKEVSAQNARVRRLAARVADRLLAVSKAPRGQKTKARKLLQKATSALSAAEKKRSALEVKFAKVQAKEADKERKRREKLKAEVEEIRRKQFPPAIGGGVVPKPSPPPPPPPPPKRVTPVAFETRHEVGVFLAGEGWKVYFYPSDLDLFDARTSVVSTTGRFEVSDLSEWVARNGVWWRAEIAMVWHNTGDLLEDTLSDPDGSLARQEASGAEFNIAGSVVVVRDGTEWHREPSGLDTTVGIIVENIRAKYGEPDALEVILFAASRNEKPESPRSLARKRRKGGGRLCWASQFPARVVSSWRGTLTVRVCPKGRTLRLTGCTWLALC